MVGKMNKLSRAAKKAGALATHPALEWAVTFRLNTSQTHRTER